MNKQILIISCLLIYSLHGMEKSSALTPEERERKEQEFEARMQAMRLEQAQRAQQSDVQFIKVEERSFGPVDGEDLLSALKKMRDEKSKEKVKAPEKLLECFGTDFASPPYVEEQKAKGYLVYPQPNGVVVFCLPGHEDKLKILLAGYNHITRLEVNK